MVFRVIARDLFLLPHDGNRIELGLGVDLVSIILLIDIFFVGLGFIKYLLIGFYAFIGWKCVDKYLQSMGILISMGKFVLMFIFPIIIFYLIPTVYVVILR